MTVWDALIGQPVATQTLQRAALEGRTIVEGSVESQRALSHAWLITGPPGSGRSTAATALAAALQCTGEPVGCGRCTGCRTTLAGSNADVRVYATDLVQFSIKEVRTWVEASYGAPSNGRWRVTIIEDADRMTERTSNVLLKSLEEPPERGIWLLCAPTPTEVLPTIRSRCRALALRTPPVDAVAEYLARMDGVTFDEAIRAATIAQSHVGFARGLLRDPGLRDNLRAIFSLPLRARSVGEAVVAADRMHERLKEVAEKRTEDINTRERAKLYQTLGIDEGKRIPPALRAQIRVMENDQKRRGRRALVDNIDRALIDLLGFYRDVLTVQLAAGTGIVNVDMEEQIRLTSSSSTPEQTMVRVEAINEARRRLHTNAAPLLILEAMIVTLVEPDG